MKLLKKPFLIIILLIIISILVAEIYLRKNNYEQLKTRRISPEIVVPDTLLGYRWIPYSSGRYCYPDIDRDITINNQGYIGPDFTENKPEDIFRIILVGTSNSAGSNIHPDSVVSVKLQKLFDQNNYKVEVINCSKGGTDRDISNLNLIKKELVKYSPDLILLEFTGKLRQRDRVFENYRNYVIRYNPNDSSARKICTDIVDNIYNHKFLTGFYDCSFIIRACCKSYQENYNSKWADDYIHTYLWKKCGDIPYFIAPTSYYTLSRSIKELSIVKDQLKDINCKLVLSSFVLNDEQKIIIDHGFDLIQLDLKSDQPISLEHDGHLNEHAHSIMANQMFYKFKEFIPEKYLIK